jgi:23S rRNA (uracil1939-C5)-methyltransferase
VPDDDQQAVVAHVPEAIAKPSVADAVVADGNGHSASTRPKRGDELELEIDSLAYGGEGVARLGDQGYVVFVAGAVPGDRVRAHVYKTKRTYAHARTDEILRPSNERIAPVAAHPGVPWQVLPYTRQLEVKQSQVNEALRRIGKLDGFEVQEIIPAAQQWRYRNKLEYSFGTDSDGELLCGFHAPARWNRVEHVEDCMLASEPSNLARQVVYRWCSEQGLGAWERSSRPGAWRMGGDDGPRRQGRPTPQERTGPGPDGRALLRNLVVREGRRTDKLQVRLVTTEGTIAAHSLADALLGELGEQRLSGVLWTRSHALGETTAGGATELLWGQEELPERICDLDVRILPEAFFQTNTEMAETLYAVAGEYAALEGWERVYDLYCGLGTIGLTLAPHAGEVWGLELLADAVVAATAGAARNGIANAHFRAGEVRLAMAELVARGGRPDVVVLDPPRAGLGRKVVERIIQASPKRIVYVSCNPTTLAADVALFVEAGWTLERVRPVDMFPQTHHIECVAVLERG